MGLRLHNTLTRTKQDFVPIDPANVRMYVCGPTVYDFIHIGNARPLIVFDVLFRLLRHLYGPEHVTYVRNITDVDDKINARAAERGISIRELTEGTTAQFHEDAAALGCLPPTHEPRATEYVSRNDAPEDMIRLIQRLIDKGNAYAAEGHVLFHVPSMPDYGRLSNRSLDDMIAGARVEVAPYKRDPMDFVLWKPSKPGEPAWPSPWGEGRPGWHIECSAMAGALLGETFDIHGGGIDLLFPHHENELAQSRCAHGTDVMANYWLHNGFLQVEGEKMAKSAGNFVTVRELLRTKDFGRRQWPGEVVRLALLMTQYREPMDFTSSRLDEALKTYDRLNRAAKYCAADTTEIDVRTLELLSDDLNTYGAVMRLRELSSLALGVKRGVEVDYADEVAAARRVFLPTVGLLGFHLEDQGLLSGETAKDVNTLIEARAAARKAKDFAEADRIRAELDAMGIQLKDAKDPKTGELMTTWEVKR